MIRDSSYLESLKFVLVREGGKVDDPDDKGGRTAYGVTQATYDAWRKKKGKPTRDVWLIEPLEVILVYEEEFWPKCKADHYDASGHEWLAMVLFDSFVNFTPKTFAKLLQTVGGVTVDGIAGPNTWDAIAKKVGELGGDAVGKLLCDAREAKYREIVAKEPGQGKFLNGWLNRVEALRAAAL